MANKKKTPLLQQLRQASGTVYVFPSASEDVGLNLNNDVNGAALTHYALLKIPALYLKDLCFGKDTDLYNPEKDISSINPNQILAMSLQNYLMNFETTLLNEDSYNYQNMKTVSERVFWHWLKAVGGLKFGTSDKPLVRILGANETDSNKKTYWYYPELKDRVVQCFGSIDSGNKVHSEFGMFNETYINIPSSYGSGPVFFQQVEDENYKTGTRYIGDENYLQGRDNSDYVSYSQGHDSPYYDENNSYIIPRVDVNNYESQFDALEIVKDFDELSTAIQRTTGNSTYQVMSFDELNIDALNVLKDTEYGSDLDITNDNMVKDEFDFNAILLYYSVYDQTDKVSRIHATNLFGIIFLDSANIITGAENNGDNRMLYIPTLHKRKSTTESFGTGYSFRVNMKTLSIYDNTGSIIQDNTTTASVISDNLNGAVQQLNKAIGILNQNVFVTARIQDQYAKIINIYDEQRENLTDVSTLLHNYVEGKINPILNVDKLYTDAIYPKTESGGRIDFYVPNVGEGYIEGADDFISAANITTYGFHADNIFATDSFANNNYLVYDTHSADYPITQDVDALTQMEATLSHRIQDHQELVTDLFEKEDILKVKVRSEATVLEGDNGETDSPYIRYDYDMYIDPNSPVFNSSLAQLITKYQPDSIIASNDIKAVNYTGLIPYIIGYLQTHNKYTYSSKLTNDEFQELENPLKSNATIPEVLDYLIQSQSILQTAITEIQDNIATMQKKLDTL